MPIVSAPTMTQTGILPRFKQHLFLFSMIFSLFLILLPNEVQAKQEIYHEIKVTLFPVSSHLRVEDRMILPTDLRPDQEGKFHFLLHEGLSPQTATAGVIIDRVEETLGLESSLQRPQNTPEFKETPAAAHYTMTLPIGLRVVVITYEGEIKHPLAPTNPANPDEEETLGIISPEGIFLSGETFWYPWFHNKLMTFSLQIELPQGWSAVSQGERTENRLKDQIRHIRWESPEPQEEIYLVGGRWTEYQRKTGRVMAMAFLRTPDPELADRYLKTTEQYLEMYQKLLGPYPYKKFALVENFWETGYGMPSFTLLGSKVLRLPFILHTSYPHEILHNWWGNGVYVDRKGGNWSEGLTTYLADYLLQEQRGKGEASRRAALQRYANGVSATNDFPLTEFQSRYDSASQAVGYGKTMFLFHMFRQILGEADFIDALRIVYQDYRFKQASFDDFERAFSRAAGRDLNREFMQWVTRTGAPILRARGVRSNKLEDGYHLTATIQQRQSGPAYSLKIPATITLHGEKAAYQTTIAMDEKEITIDLLLPARPIRLKIDPEYDLFRRLSPAEIPPSLSKVFGAESILILLPETAPKPLRKAYKKLAESMQQAQPEQIEIGWDNTYKTLPEDRDIWLFGWENRFQRVILSQLQVFGLSTTSAMIRIEQTQIPRRNHSLVFSVRHPKHVKYSLNWLATDHAAALPVLGRKLPHYGSFGYLGFQGAAVKNIVRGRWPAVRSPMSIRIKQGDGRWIKEEPASVASRKPLATISPLFSEKRMEQDIAFLSARSMKGRGFGTLELDNAAEYIAASFREAGLKTAGNSGRSFLQQWTDRGSGIGSGVALKNVVAILPGTAPGLSNEYIVVGAHYDHLGFGWPRVHQGNEGKLHPGANGNASGVALLLELARLFKQDKPLKRSIIFAAFTGKEVGLRGSAHLALNRKPSPRVRITGMLNLDTIGRLSQNRLFVLGTGSSREWSPILRRAGVDTGVEVVSFPDILGSSDHVSFIDADIPAVQFFSGITPDSDRPTDTPEKINLPGMVAVGRVVKTVIGTLANRPTSLSVVSVQKATPSPIWQRRKQN